MDGHWKATGRRYIPQQYGIQKEAKEESRIIRLERRTMNRFRPSGALLCKKRDANRGRELGVSARTEITCAAKNANALSSQSSGVSCRAKREAGYAT